MPLLTPSTQRSIVLIGKESTGKSQLIASLTGHSPYSTNFRGSTVACETGSASDYCGIGHDIIPSPWSRG